jgi:hypothetical protein
MYIHEYIYIDDTTENNRPKSLAKVESLLTAFSPGTKIKFKSIFLNFIIDVCDDDDVYLRLQHLKRFHNLVYMA